MAHSSIAIDFALRLLSVIHSANLEANCQKFSQQEWCNCHSTYLIRIGVDDGKGILYVDVNGQVNVAGRTINNASRVMNLADKSCSFSLQGRRILI